MGSYTRFPSNVGLKVPIFVYGFFHGEFTTPQREDGLYSRLLYRDTQGCIRLALRRGSAFRGLGMFFLGGAGALQSSAMHTG